MTNYPVTVSVTPCVRIECKFWLGDDGWNGSSENPPVSVQSSSFAQVKAEMEFALANHIEALLEITTPITQRKTA
jgi:hypothetical protein